MLPIPPPPGTEHNFNMTTSEIYINVPFLNRYLINCDPPQEFDAKGESTRTTRLHDTLSVP